MQARLQIKDALFDARDEVAVPQSMLHFAQLIADQIDAVAVPRISMHPTNIEAMAKTWKIHIQRDRIDAQRRSQGLPPVSFFGPDGYNP
jgi:hypothetical protein